MITQTHRLDVVPGGITTVVHVKQYQTDESLVFDLFSRFGDFAISAAFTECMVRGTKSDGNGYSANATCDPSNNSVTVQLTEQMTAVAGRQPYEITVTDSTGRMITTTFILDVHRAALDADTVESESVIKEVQTIVEEYIEDNPGLFVVDPTLTQSGEAADAKVTGDEIADLKSALYTCDITVEQGYWLISDGTGGHSNNWCRTADYIPINAILKTSAIQMLLQAWTAAGVYVGTWAGTEFNKAQNDSTTRFFYISINEWMESYPNYKFKVTFHNYGSAFNPSVVYGEADFINFNEETRDMLDSYLSKTNQLSFTEQISACAKNVYIPVGDTVQITATQWRTKYIKVPSGKTIHVVCLHETFFITGFDEKFNLVGDLVGSYGNEHASDVDLIVNIPSNVQYIRAGFYNASGKPADFSQEFQLYYYDDDYKVADNSLNLANSFEWSMCSLGNGIAKSNNTIGLHSLVKAEKDMYIKVDSTYIAAFGIWDSSDSTQASILTQWFTNDIRECYVPQGFYVWVGLRLADSSAQEYLIPSMESVLTMQYIEPLTDIVGNSVYQYGNGYIVGGPKANARKGFMGYKHVDRPTLIHLNNNNVVYTLVYCTGTFDYSGTNWVAAFSQTRDIIIPANSWYNVTIQGEYSDLSIIPLEIDVYSLGLFNYANSLGNKLGTMLERIKRLENAGVPSYYQTHIESKVTTINSLHNDNGCQFVFITDTHVNGYQNALNSKALLTYIVNNSLATMVVDGGDMWNGGQGTDMVESLNLIRQGTDYTTPDCTATRYQVIGNHDSGTDYINGTKYQGIVPVDDYAVVSQLHINDPIIVIDPKNSTQYYFDDENSLIRYVFLNFELRDESTGEGYVDTCRFFMTAINTAKNGYRIILFTHQIWNTTVISDFMQSVMSAIDGYNSRQTVTLAGVNFDCSKAAAKIYAMISGHTHADRSTTTTNGVPIIATTTDNAGGETGGLTRTIGTVSEQAFDVFTFNFTTRKLNATRIGAGSDREFDLPSF